VINALEKASRPSAEVYAACVVEDEAEHGPPAAEVEIFEPSPHDPYAVPVPPLTPAQLLADADVEVFIPSDGEWVPARVLEVMPDPEGPAGAMCVRVDTYSRDGSGLAQDAERREWKKVMYDAQSLSERFVCLRHLRSPVPCAAALAASSSSTRERDGVVRVREAELEAYDGLLPEGAVGHTTEVLEQILIEGPRARMTEHYVPLATALMVLARLRRFVAANAAAKAAAPPVDTAALFAGLAGDLGAAASGAAASGAAAAGPVLAPSGMLSDEEEEPSDVEEEEEGVAAAQADVDVTFPRSRDAALARALLGLPHGFDLAKLTPADVPATLPPALQKLLGKARRFTPATGPRSAAAGMQARHMKALQRALAERTRCRWDEDTGRVEAGNPHAGLIVRVVIEQPRNDLQSGGRAIVDTRGAQGDAHGGDASGATAATAASLAAAGSLILVVSARNDQARLALRNSRGGRASRTCHQRGGHGVQSRAPAGHSAARALRCALGRRKDGRHACDGGAASGRRRC
jgi:hypothetical protein